MTKLIEKLKTLLAFAKRHTVALLIVLVVLMAGLAFYFYQKSSDLNQNPQLATQQEIKSLVASVSQLMDLPQGEDPTVATVVDPVKLMSQPFFANAKKGDKVLIYTNTHKAILYDPSRNRIVEVAQISINSDLNQQPAPTPAPTPAPATTTKK